MRYPELSPQHCQECPNRLLLLGVPRGQGHTSLLFFPIIPAASPLPLDQSLPFHDLSRSPITPPRPSPCLSVPFVSCSPTTQGEKLGVGYVTVRVLFLKNIQGNFIAFPFARRMNTALLPQLGRAPFLGVTTSFTLFLCNIFITPSKQQQLILTLSFYNAPLCFLPTHTAVQLSEYSPLIYFSFSH